MPAATHRLPLVIAALLFTAAALADDYNWQGAGTGGNTATDPADPTTLWSNPANWLEGTVPGDEDTAYIPFANAGRLNAQTATVQSLYADGDSRKGVFQIRDGVDFAVSNTAYIGYAGEGWIIQDGGTHTVGQSLYIGYEEKSEGTYELRNGDLTVLSHGPDYGNTTLGWYGEGSFLQSGGTHTARGLGLGEHSTYDLAAGNLSIAWKISFRDRAVFTQTGGACHASILHLPHQGSQTLAGGTYRLSGGSLLTDEEDLDQGVFDQSGGSHTVGYLGVGRNGQFRITGGTLNILHGVGGEGTLDLGGVPIAIEGPNRLVNLSEVTLLNAEHTSLHLGEGSLLVIPAGFEPSQAFQSYSNAGITHVAGTALVVDADQAVRGWGEIDDYVETAGTIAASPGGGIYLNGGLRITGGSVNLGDGILHFYKADSHIAGGSIAARSARFSGVSVLQTKGILTTTDGLYVLGGTYNLRGGTLVAGTEGDFVALEIQGGNGNSLWAQTGGELIVNGYTNVRGEHEVASLYSQSGGIHITESLWVGSYDDARATANYVLSDGELAVRDRESISSTGPATFTQTGGTHTVAGTLEVGDEQYEELGNGTLILAGGSLVTGNLIVGTEPRPFHEAAPHLCLAGSQAYLEVRDTFRLGHGALLTAVDGAAVHMTGSAFENHSTNEAALAGLENLAIIFEGGTDHWATFEVAGEDLGAGLLGFLDNFALGSLVAGGVEPAMLRIEDLFDNGNRASPEALYVHDLAIGAGSTLDLNGLHLYYVGTFVNEGAVIGGAPAWAPEPATLAFVLLGGLVLLRRR